MLMCMRSTNGPVPCACDQINFLCCCQHIITPVCSLKMMGRMVFSILFVVMRVLRFCGVDNRCAEIVVQVH